MTECYFMLVSTYHFVHLNGYCKALQTKQLIWYSASCSTQ
uniref:Uncharacterized protein n=1 Tax=Anguilla anguilla TaxID=7936 RepID=A0A0E9WKK6_ANGAN